MIDFTKDKLKAAPILKDSENEGGLLGDQLIFVQEIFIVLRLKQS